MATVGDGHGDGRGLRRPLLAVHRARRRAEAGSRGHHRADEPGGLSGASRTDGNGSAHARPIVSRVRARARGERGLPHGADRPRHRAANEDLARAADPFLGKGSVTISEIRSTSPSLCAVADSCTIHLDRRLTRGETLERAVAQVEALESVQRAGATVHVLDYARASYTGLTYPTRKYYPTWTVEEDHAA